MAVHIGESCVRSTFFSFFSLLHGFLYGFLVSHFLFHFCSFCCIVHWISHWPHQRIVDIHTLTCPLHLVTRNSNNFQFLIFSKFNDSHNRLDIFVFYRYLKKRHHLCCMLPNWKPQKPSSLKENKNENRLINKAILPRSRIDDFNTELTASRFFCISAKFCCRIRYDPAMSSFKRCRLV